MNVFELTSDVLTLLFSEWMALEDVAKVDGAVTNSILRSRWLTEIRRQGCVLEDFYNKCGDSALLYRWILLRGVCVNDIHVNYYAWLSELREFSLSTVQCQALISVRVRVHHYQTGLEHEFVHLLSRCSNLTSLAVNGPVEAVRTLIAALHSPHKLRRLALLNLRPDHEHDDYEYNAKDCLPLVTEVCPNLTHLRFGENTVRSWAEEEDFQFFLVDHSPRLNVVFPCLESLVVNDDMYHDTKYLAGLIRSSPLLTAIEIDFDGGEALLEWLMPRAATLKRLAIICEWDATPTYRAALSSLLQECRCLESFSVRSLERVDVNAIVGHLSTSVTHVNIGRALSEDVIALVTRLPNLTSLHTSNVEVDDDQLTALMKVCPVGLRILRLTAKPALVGSAQQVSGEAVKRMFALRGRLGEVELNARLVDADLAEMAPLALHLKTLCLAYQGPLTDKALRKFMADCPRLTDVRFLDRVWSRKPASWEGYTGSLPILPRDAVVFLSVFALGCAFLWRYCTS